MRLAGLCNNCILAIDLLDGADCSTAESDAMDTVLVGSVHMDAAEAASDWISCQDFPLASAALI